MPTFDLLREADMLLNICGRPVPPPGYRFVDLPYVLPFFQSFTTPPGTPFQARIENTRDTVFLVRGVAMSMTTQARIRWPDGRFLSQFPGNPVSDSSFPQGLGPNMLALPQERPIRPGARISVEFSGSGTGTQEISFWGVLRYLMRIRAEKGDDPNALVSLMPNPVQSYGSMPRLRCGSNQNIMAPEFLLGNQCTPETPAGWVDESFNFQAAPIVVPANGQNYNNALIIPGADDVVIRAISAQVTFSGGLVATPTFAIRLPNGYSITGGDMVPITLICPRSPIFPTLRLHAGDRVIIDMADMSAVGSGSSSTILQFDGVKRRRAQ